MDRLLELILALLQGLTEPLPISSSGHLVLAKAWFGIDQPGLSFEAFVNLGSLLGVVAYYQTFLFTLLKSAFRELKQEDKPHIHYILQVGIATIPALLAGLVFADMIEQWSTPAVIGVMLLITGVLLWMIHRRPRTTRLDVTYTDASLMGGAQAVAIMPGLSRSGLTTIMGLFRGLEFSSTLRFSLMMYIPISIAAGAWSVVTSDSAIGFSGWEMLYLLTAALGTYIMIGSFIRIVEARKLHWLAVYCFIVGTLAIVLL
jgi:undecaprenyl-diphosphatase